MENAVQQRIAYRRFEERDTPAIFRLWEEDSGWGGISMQQFTHWFLNTPYGNCLIVVAVDEEGEVKGQLVYTPVRVLAGGVVLKALRAAAPILHRSLRSTHLHGPEHPAVGLIKQGLLLAAEEGYQVVYTFPAYGWLGMMQRIQRSLPYPADIVCFDCLRVSLTEPWPQPLSQEITVSELSAFTTEHEALWADAVQQLPVRAAVHREAVWLNRVAAGHHTKLEARDDGGRLIGYAIFKKDTGLLNDLVARNTADLKCVFDQMVWAMHHQNAARVQVPFEVVKCMATPAVQALLHDRPFATEDYHFVFALCLTDPTLTLESFTVSNWYLTPMG